MRLGWRCMVVLLMVALFMVNNNLTRCRTRFSCWLTVFILIFLAIGTGCNSAYRVSNLPADCLAPSPVNADTINLAGLTDTTVSREIIQLGDILEITMVTDYSKLTTTSTPVRVADDGTISVPLVGKVAVVGLEVEQAEQVIAGESIARGVFRNPCITATMKQCRTNRITVVGAVDKPGQVDLPRASSSLLSALVAAGGMNKEADTEIEIRRTDARNMAPNQAQAGMTQAADRNGNGLVLASHQQEQPACAADRVKSKSKCSCRRGRETAGVARRRCSLRSQANAEACIRHGSSSQTRGISLSNQSGNPRFGCYCFGRWMLQSCGRRRASDPPASGQGGTCTHSDQPPGGQAGKG